MDRADQSVTRHAAASRAAYETLYAAFASQPGGIKDSHRGVLQSLQAELRLDQTFADGVTARHDNKRQRTLRGSSAAAAGGGQSGEEKSSGGGGGLGDAGGGLGETPGIQIEWKEVGRRQRPTDRFFVHTKYHIQNHVRTSVMMIDDFVCLVLRLSGERQ